MRLSELLHRDVLDVSGTRVGAVVDIRLVQDGPMIGPYGASLRASGLIVATKGFHRLLGYERDLRPIIFRWIVHWRTGDVLFVPWETIVDPRAERMRLSVAADNLTHLHEMPDRRAVADT